MRNISSDSSDTIFRETEAHASALEEELGAALGPEAQVGLGGIVEALGQISRLGEGFDARDRDSIAQTAIPYLVASGTVTAHVNALMGSLGERGTTLTNDLRQGIFVGLSLVAVAGLLSAAGFGWASRRAHRLRQDFDRAKEVESLKSEFVALASHELRTPLTGIYGFSQLLAESERMPGEERKWAEYVSDESGRLAEIVDALLNVARIESGGLSLARENVRFGEIADTVVRSQQEGTELHTISVEGDLSVIVTGDRARLIEVLSNLTDNAIKYSPDGGEVRIRCSEGSEFLTVSVTDEGLGVPASELSRLFERFHRINRPETAKIRSSGLGLYLVKRLVEEMGGEVAATSTEGQGSTFSFTVPLGERELVEAA